DGQPVDLQFGLERRPLAVGEGAREAAADAGVPRPQLVGVEGVAEGEERDGVAHLLERLQRLAADAEGGRVGRLEAGEAGLQRLERAEEPVVLGVADERAVLDVVGAREGADGRAQPLDERLGLRLGHRVGGGRVEAAERVEGVLDDGASGGVGHRQGVGAAAARRAPAAWRESRRCCPFWGVMRRIWPSCGRHSNPCQRSVTSSGSIPSAPSPHRITPSLLSSTSSSPGSTQCGRRASGISVARKAWSPSPPARTATRMGSVSAGPAVCVGVAAVVSAPAAVSDTAAVSAAAGASVRSGSGVASRKRSHRMAATASTKAAVTPMMVPQERSNERGADTEAAGATRRLGKCSLGAAVGRGGGTGSGARERAATAGAFSAGGGTGASVAGGGAAPSAAGAVASAGAAGSGAGGGGSGASGFSSPRYVPAR